MPVLDDRRATRTDVRVLNAQAPKRVEIKAGELKCVDPKLPFPGHSCWPDRKRAVWTTSASQVRGPAQAGSGAEPDVDRRARRQRGSLLGKIYLLGIQFALGMAVDLFVTVSASPSGFWWPVVRGPAAILVLHIVLGTFLLVNSIVILAHAIRVARPAPRLLAGLGSAALFAAFASGRVFLGNNQNGASQRPLIGRRQRLAVQIPCRL